MEEKIPVTACVITFNEEDNIRHCLEKLVFCQAIIVVDSHSSDQTRELAQELSAKVIERDWPGHIEQKNFAIEQAQTDWVICIDADERITPELEASIRALFIGETPSADGYELSRRTHYLGRFIDHGGFYPDRKLRLFRRSRGRWGGVNPHDHVHLDGGAKPGQLTGDLHHYSYRDIADHLKTIDYFTTIAAQEKLSRGRQRVLPRLLFAPPWKFFRMFVLQRGFLDGVAGLVVAFLGSFYVMLKYAKLWELIAVDGRRPGAGDSVAYGRKGETS